MYRTKLIDVIAETLLQASDTPLVTDKGTRSRSDSSEIQNELPPRFLPYAEPDNTYLDHMRLTTAGAQMYLTTSHVTLACGVLSWDEYLLRLRFVKDCADAGTLEVRVSAEILREQEFNGEDEWSKEEPEQLGSDQGASESQISISDRYTSFEPPALTFIAAGSTGLHQWQFRQSDPDFFPSIPHGHSRSDRRRKLDAYRGWTYQEDRQFGREPRWKIIALWNDDKFRSFAAAAIQYYLVAFPRYVWPVQYPLKLPRRRGKESV